MRECPLQGSDQRGIFGIVVGTVTQKTAQLCQRRPRAAGNHNAVAGRPGITARAAINVGSHPIGRGFFCRAEEFGLFGSRPRHSAQRPSFRRVASRSGSLALMMAFCAFSTS